MAAKKPKKAKKRSFVADSPWVKLQKEVRQDPEVRHRLIRPIEKELGAKVYTYFTSFSDERAQISDTHAEMLENVLSAEHDGGKLVLIINSPGGQALAAERIVNVCRAYSTNEFETLVPHMAKSAATMICFGASKIHMSKTCELGPVDPQVIYQDDSEKKVWTSAAEYVRSYEKLMDHATSGKAKRLEALLQQLGRYDARYIERLISHQELSADISVRLLQTGMMKGETATVINRKIAPFLIQRRKSSHGRMINAEEAMDCGLNVDIVPHDSALWARVWELYVRSDWMVSNQCLAMIESAKSSIMR